MSSRSQRKQAGFSRLIALLLMLVVLIGGLSLAFVNRQKLYDAYRLNGYQAPSSIADLATQDTMTANARRIFYVNHPLVMPKASFNANCPNNGGEQSIVLGCYHSNQDGIYLLRVADNRLDGVVQVTAAHEMLHAAYDRLSSSDKQSVNAMLEDYYHNQLTDQRIKQTIDGYKKTEPTELVNEMHSIFGTEVANLPAPLEQYYKRYFADRSMVTGFAARYQGEFTSRRTAIAQDDAQLKQLKTQLDNNQGQLKTRQEQINQQRSQLDAARSSGDISSFNAGVPSYNTAIANYNSLVQATRDLTNQYNQIVRERNAVALEQNQLSEDLSSGASPIQ